jgi:hypothetical protein
VVRAAPADGAPRVKGCEEGDCVDCDVGLASMYMMGGDGRRVGGGIKDAIRTFTQHEIRRREYQIPVQEVEQEERG